MICRLVENQDLGRLGQRAGQNHPLLFTARKGLEVPVSVAFHAYLVQCIQSYLVVPLPFLLQQGMEGIPPHQGDVQHGIVKINLVELAHHRHVPRQLFAGKMCDVLVVQTNDAAVHLLCAVDGSE